ncbi:hypothetical protein JCM10213_009185 [Rhodosporidiobolus nylandii]
MSLASDTKSMKDAPDRVEVLAVGGALPTTEELTGHRQELRVSMGLGALLALSFANMAPTTAINGSLPTALASGGPVAVLWGWVIVAIISLAIAASLAEMCSAWPHAAGQAFWAYQLAPPKWRTSLSYWTAWWNIAGGWALIAAGAFILAEGIMALATAYNPSYTADDWHLVLLYLALLFLFFLCNLFMVRILDLATKGFALVNIASVLATIIALAACAPVKAKPSFVFGGFVNETGWSSRGFVFLLGLLQSSFTIIGYEASSHLCEEAHDAARLAPLAIFGGTAIVGVVGLVWIIALLFCIADVDAVLGTATGVPVLQIFEDSFGLRGATAAYVINLLILSFAIIGIICASSRAVWAMSRDKGFPGSVVFSKVQSRLKVPLYACLLQVTVPAILGLIYLGSTSIFFSSFQITTIGYLTSYLIPISLLFFRGRQHLAPGYYRLPERLGKVCNGIALLYCPFICVLFCLPNFYPVTSTNMNYSSPICAVLVLIGTIGWYAECRSRYKGPGSSAYEDVVVSEAELWETKYGGSPDLSFSGITTFAHVPHRRCLDEAGGPLDIAVLGFPFDTAVSYRGGARFGPNGIRQGSRRMATNRGYSIPWNFNPFLVGADVTDCGDVPISPYDNTLALDQMEAAYRTLLARPVKTAWTKANGGMKTLALDGKEHPKIVSLGGDHTIVLPILRSLKQIYGPVTVIHFDAHLDSWNGALYRGALTPQSQITHGSFFYTAYEEGLISNHSVHAGIRTRLSGFSDLTDDVEVGFKLFTVDDLDELGTDGIIAAIKERVGDTPVYLSLDIDVFDPSMAPATGTPEPGGWTSREGLRLLRGLSSLRLVGADVVEVSPPFDSNAEVTTTLAANIVIEMISMMLKEKTLGGEKKWKPAVSGGELYPPHEIKREKPKAAHEEL